MQKVGEVADADGNKHFDRILSGEDLTGMFAGSTAEVAIVA